MSKFPWKISKLLILCYYVCFAGYCFASPNLSNIRTRCSGGLVSPNDSNFQQPVVCGAICDNSWLTLDPGLWYFQSCVSQPAGTTYFNPQITIQTQFVMEWDMPWKTYYTSMGNGSIDIGVGECGMLNTNTTRYCARLTRPTLWGNPGIGTTDPITNTTIYDGRFPTQLCVFEDPRDGNDTHIYSSPFHYYTDLSKLPADTNSQTQAAHNSANAASVLFAGAVVVGATSIIPPDPVGLLAAAVLAVAGGLAELIELGMNTANQVVIGNYHGDPTNHDSQGCVNIPLAPGPPPFCPTIVPMAAPVFTNAVCEKNEVPSFVNQCVQGNTATTGAPNGTPSNFFKPQIRVSFQHQVPICGSTNNAISNAEMCVTFNKNASFNYPVEHPTEIDYIHYVLYDFVPDCSINSGTICAALSNVNAGLYNPNYFRVLYSSNTVPLSISEWINLADSSTSAQGLTLSLYGVDRGDYGFLSYSYDANNNFTASPNITLESPYDTTHLIRTFSATASPDNTQICANEVVASANHLIKCAPRPRVPTPVVANCTVNTDPTKPCIKLTITDPTNTSNTSTNELLYINPAPASSTASPIPIIQTFGLTLTGNAVISDINYRFPNLLSFPTASSTPDFSMFGQYQMDPTSTTGLATYNICNSTIKSNCASIQNALDQSDIHNIYFDILPQCSFDNSGICVNLPKGNVTKKFVRVLYSQAGSSTATDLYSSAGGNFFPINKASYPDNIATLDSLIPTVLTALDTANLYYNSGIEFDKNANYIRGATRICLNNSIYPPSQEYSDGESVLALTNNNGLANTSPVSRIYPLYNRYLPDPYQIEPYPTSPGIIGNYTSGAAIVYPNINLPTAQQIGPVRAAINPGPCRNNSTTDNTCLMSGVEAPRGMTPLELGLCVDITYQPTCDSTDIVAGNIVTTQAWDASVAQIGVLQTKDATACIANYAPTDPSKKITRRCAYDQNGVTTTKPSWTSVTNPCIPAPPPAAASTQTGG